VLPSRSLTLALSQRARVGTRTAQGLPIIVALDPQSSIIENPGTDDYFTVFP
jgi:hypothetical protein